MHHVEDLEVEDVEGASRRSFLLSTGSLFTTAWLGTQWAAITAAAHHAGDMAAAELAGAPAWRGFQFLSDAESQDVDAIAAQIEETSNTYGLAGKPGDQVAKLSFGQRQRGEAKNGAGAPPFGNLRIGCN